MGDGEEFSCLLTLANLCQVVAGMAQDWLVPPEDSVILALFVSLPFAATALEDLAMQCVMRDFLLKLQRAIHANFHKRFEATCGEEPVGTHGWPAGMSIAQVVRASVWEFRAEFHRRHGAVDITKALIVSQLASPPRTTALARAVGMSRRALERAFLSTTNETIVAFRTRERVVRLDRLVKDGMKFREAAKEVGWKSAKDAYRAYKRLLGALPHDR